jgi:CDP-glucose 4,6-dehydratase
MHQEDNLNTFKGKRVFVTGHTGFKGSWLVAWLHLLGAEIKGYALAPEHERGIFNILEGSSLCESVIGEIRDQEKLSAAITSFQPDFVFHLAAQPLVRYSYIEPAETFDINVIGTANVLNAIRLLPASCAVVIVTTDKVYENNEWWYPYREVDPLGGYDPYSASKACAEIVVNSFRQSFFNVRKLTEHGKAIASARAGNVIGGGDWSDDRIIPDIVKSLQSKKTIQVRNPKAIRPWQHVLEPIYGYLLLAKGLVDRPTVFSGAYNFGPLPSDFLPVENLVQHAISCWGTGDYETPDQTNQPHEAGILKLDISKAIKQLAWIPKLNSGQSIEWTIDWYKKSPMAQRDYTYSQIKQFQALR